MKKLFLKILVLIFLILLLIFGIYYIFFYEQEIKALKEEGRIKEYETITSDNIRIGIIDCDNLNPILSNNKNVQDISRLIFDPLFTLTQDYRVEGRLAQEYTKLDSKNYIIKLKNNIQWHDNNKFDSTDVIFTINILKKLKEESIYYYNVKDISNIKKIDEYTIKLTTYNEIPYFEYNLIFPILSSKYYNEENIKSVSKNIKPVGTGNFYISNIENRNILLKKANINNWEKENLKIDTITLKSYDSISSIINAYNNEEIDLFTTSNENIEEYLKNINYNQKEYLSRDYEYIALNCNNSILSNVEVRQAIAMAINKEQIVQDVYKNKYKVSNFPLDFGSFVYENNSIVRYNQEYAKTVLIKNNWKFSSIGWSKKNNNSNLIIQLNLIVDKQNVNLVKVASLIKEQLKNIGIIIDIKEVSHKEYTKYLQNKKYDMIIVQNSYGYSPSLEKYFGEDNLANYENKKIKTLLNDIELCDEKEIKEKYTQIVEIFNKENPYIYLGFNTNKLIYSRSLKGQIEPNSYNLFYNIETWYREYKK